MPTTKIRGRVAAGVLTAAGVAVAVGNLPGDTSSSAHPPVFHNSVGDEPERASPGQIVLPADAYNQCYLDFYANGEKFRGLADSGAAGVYFSIKDARRLGYDPDSLSLDHSYSGWGWKVRGATVQLKSLNVAGMVLHDVKASIDGLGSVTDNNVPLIGSPVLKLMNFQVRDGYCTLTVPANVAAVSSNRRKRLAIN